MLAGGGVWPSPSSHLHSAVSQCSVVVRRAQPPSGQTGSEPSDTAQTLRKEEGGGESDIRATTALRLVVSFLSSSSISIRVTNEV